MTSVPNPEPGKFAQSAPFRRLLAEFVVEDDSDGHKFLVHEGCGAEVTQISEPDGLDTIIQAAIDHDC